MIAALAAAILILSPRLLIISLWLLSGWFNNVFPAWYWPVMGFFCLPLTTLWYSAVINRFAGQWDTLQIIVMVLAVMMDLGFGFFRRRKTGSVLIIYNGKEIRHQRQDL